MKVCVGGTFDILHKGHKKLLTTAFQTAGEHGTVFIGLTTKKKPRTTSYIQRKKALETYLTQENITQLYQIKPIHDKYGPTLEEDFDAIIVSPETRPTAEQINQLRQQKGKKPIHIIQIPFVLAEDHYPISSTRIRQHQITTDGKLLKSD
ncbi:MAG: phosphopantetheine adenylyltransferase [Methanobacteriota archaeon]